MKTVAKQLTKIPLSTCLVQFSYNRVTLTRLNSVWVGSVFSGEVKLWQKISAVFMTMTHSNKREGKTCSKANINIQVQHVMTAGPAVKLANKALVVMLPQTLAAVAPVAISLITRY